MANVIHIYRWYS